MLQYVVQISIFVSRQEILRFAGAPVYCCSPRQSRGWERAGTLFPAISLFLSPFLFFSCSLTLHHTTLSEYLKLSVMHIFKAHLKEKGAVPEEEAQIHRIRITLTSRNVKSLEKGNRQLKSSTSWISLVNLHQIIWTQIKWWGNVALLQFKSVSLCYWRVTVWGLLVDNKCS